MQHQINAHSCNHFNAYLLNNDLHNSEIIQHSYHSAEKYDYWQHLKHMEIMHYTAGVNMNY